MKTKKILAIVTLVAFMISILPMAAFAAAANNFTSRIYVEEGATAVANPSKESIDLEVVLNDSTGASATASGLKFYVATERGVSVDKVAIDSDSVGDATITGTGTNYYEITSSGTDFNGKNSVKLNVSSVVAGTTKIAVGLVSSATNFLFGATGANTSNCQIITSGSTNGTGITTLTFTAASANSIVLSPVVVGTTVKANGASYREVKATVKSGNTPISGKEVSFTIDKSGATLSATKATTDAKGEAKVKVFATKPGTYEVTASVSGVNVTATKTDLGDGGTVGIKANKTKLTFDEVGVFEINAKSDNNQKIALDTNASFKFGFADGNGNKISVASNTDLTSKFSNGNFTLGKLDGAELRVITKPSGASISEKPKSTDVSFDTDDGNAKITLLSTAIDKEGDYAIRLTLANGKSVTYNFNVKEQGTVTKMTLKYDTESLSKNGESSKPTVKLLDAEGYSKTMNNNDSTLSFALDRADLASFKAGAGNDGVVVVNNTDDTGVVTVTAVNSDKNLVATATITVQKAASSLKITAPSYNKVGEDATLTVQLIDVDGKPVAGGKPGNSVAADALVISKPDGSIVNGETGKDVSADFHESGKFSLSLSSNTVGAVTVQVIAKDTTANKTYTGSAVVNFGEEAAAQKALTMFIGSTNYVVGGVPALTDAAPFIQNGRTYVAVRPIGDALGATINWDAATQTVTLTKPGEVVTIVIGASTIKVDRAGVVTEYPTDAPAQIKDGRTYLPFRAIGEAMGYEVNFDAATQAVTFK